MNLNLIYDVGMLNGDDTAYYLHKGFNVVAIEANPNMVEIAQNRFSKEIEENRLTILNLAISEKGGTTEFWVNDEWPELSSIHKKFTTRLNQSCHSINVPCETFENILERFGVPYYLKIDIEGNDHLCLNALTATDVPTNISLEAGGIESLLLLKNLGYSQFQLVDQISLSALNIPQHIQHRKTYFYRWLLHSNAIPLRVIRKLVGRSFLNKHAQKSRVQDAWYFPPGSSGPFGKFRPGPWADWQQVAFYWLEVHQRHIKNPDRFSFPWCDYHATRESFV